MSNTQKKVASFIASGAMLAYSVLPALAATTSLEITGNGADSDNETKVEVETTTTVVQSNEANISNNISSKAETGDNEAEKNTNGDVSVSTGDATSVVSVDNTVNKNVAEVSGCCANDASVEISGNGADSHNDAHLDLDTETQVFQANEAKIINNVESKASTGENEANKNTGGEVSIDTGDAGSGVYITNKANMNSAVVGGGEGGGSLSLKILGNGADSRNDIHLDFDRSLVLDQENSAKILNDVKSKAETGENEAEKNTGGSNEITTGDAASEVAIDNMANFNWADTDCGCLFDVTAKIAGNGADSHNKIKADLEDSKELFQDNEWYCGYGHHRYPKVEILLDGFEGGHDKGCNTVDSKASTGENEVEESTGNVYGDPVVDTGDAYSYVEAGNSGNMNMIGVSQPDWGFELPEGFSFNLNFSFSLADLLAALH